MENPTESQICNKGCASLKRSLSYNDLKKKRMLRSQKSRSKIKCSRPELAETNFIKKMPDTQTQMSNFIKQIKGVIQNYEDKLQYKHKTATVAQSKALDQQSSHFINSQPQTKPSLKKSCSLKKMGISLCLNLAVKPASNHHKQDALLHESRANKHKILKRINKSITGPAYRKTNEIQKISLKTTKASPSINLITTRELTVAQNIDQSDLNEQEIEKRDETLGLSVSEIQMINEPQISLNKDFSMMKILGALDQKQKPESNCQNKTKTSQLRQQMKKSKFRRESSCKRIPKDFFK